MFAWFEAELLPEFERLIRVFEAPHQNELVQVLLTVGPPHGSLISRGPLSPEFIAFLDRSKFHIRVGSPAG